MGSLFGRKEALLTVLSLLLSFQLVYADQDAPKLLPASTSDSRNVVAVTIGAAPVVSPVFFGSKDYGFSIFPDLRLKYGEVLSASVPEGLTINVVNEDDLKLGPIAKIRFGRDEESGGSPFLISGSSNGLQGLGDVGTAGEFGVFAEYSIQKFRLRMDIRQGVGGHNGIVGDVSATYGDRFGPVSYRIGPRMSGGSSSYVNTYFGVDSVQSSRSGLERYEGTGGITSFGFGGTTVIPLAKNTAVTIFYGYDRLAPTTGNSPLVEVRGSEDQLTFGMAFGYRFEL
jgi:outer membrane protein